MNPHRLASKTLNILILAALAANSLALAPAVRGEPATGRVTVTLDAGSYALQTDQAGQTTIAMAGDFGSFAAPGQPRLPGHTYLLALPPGARVTGVQFEAADAWTLPQAHRLEVAPATTTPGLAAGNPPAVGEALIGPGEPAAYLGQAQWRAYTLAQVAYQPFTYQAASGALRFHPRLQVTVSYSLPQAGSPEQMEAERLRGDHVLDDMIAPQIANFNQARAWYGEALSSSQYDYVILVPDAAVAAAVAPFKAWKETLGHTVMVTTTTWIEGAYTGADRMERVWNFLHEKYPADAWGIRYVLIVGDMRALLTPRVYYADEGWGLRSDHFFAKLSGGTTAAAVWNHDGDSRWGELHDDELSLLPDVLVGRLPLNTPAEVTAAVQAMITFEQDSGGWKHHALLAGGYNDIASATVKTDNAVPLELIQTQLLAPNGWSALRLYEMSGLGISSYTPPQDLDASQGNVLYAWTHEAHGLNVLMDHGSEEGLSGLIWHHDNLTTTAQVDKGETTWSDLIRRQDAISFTTSTPPIVLLAGCSSAILVGPPWPDPDHSLALPGNYVRNTGGDLLANGGAAGVVGFYSPVPYMSSWITLTNGQVQTLAYYFVENLVQNHHTLGQAVFETKIRYNANFWSNNYQPFHWALNLLGDPSMSLEGYDQSALGSNRTIHSGPVYDFATDNDDNGDMYVAVNTRASNVDGQIKVYRSTDHGLTWAHWATVDANTGITALDILVGRWQSEELVSSRLLVFYGTANGSVWVVQVELANPATKYSYQIQSGGDTPASVYRVAAARDPVAMPADYFIYLAWETYQSLASAYKVTVARSAINGSVWTDAQSFNGYQQPHLDAGPDGHVYLAAVGQSFPNHVVVKSSTNRAVGWSSWTNLTEGDGATVHGAPAVGASSDAAYPTVWVAYNYYSVPAYGAADLRQAYSTNGGANWTKNLSLSTEAGVDELMPDMAGYRTSPSRWMNIAYHHSQSARNNVIWRWVSGSVPNAWWGPRLVNDHDSHPAIGPQIIYSPGAAQAGSGVVYPGTGAPVSNLYFAAPWLPAAQLAVLAEATAEPVIARAPDLTPLVVGAPTFVEPPPAAWEVMGPLSQTFQVAGLARAADGTLYAATTASLLNEANSGLVWRSTNGGATWTSLAQPPNAWWLSDVLVTAQGALLAAGSALDLGVLPLAERGVIYRSINGGQSWAIVAEPPGTFMVHRLLQRANGNIVAGAGPDGVVLASDNDGANWGLLGGLPAGGEVYALAESEGQVLYAGGVSAGGVGLVYRRAPGEPFWQATGPLEGATAVYALLTAGPEGVFAGASAAGGVGRVYRSENSGGSWQSSNPLGASRAVRSLLGGPSGEMYAGLEMDPGQYTSYVYLSGDGGANWQPAGALLLADTVLALLRTPSGEVLAASGDTRGQVYITDDFMPPNIYLPVVLR